MSFERTASFARARVARPEYRRHKARRRLSLLGLGTALALAAAACGTSGATTSSSATAAGSGRSATPTVVVADSTQYGRYLATPAGFALYTYTADEPGGRGCTGACLQYWPPLLLPSGQSTPVPGPGASGLGTFTRDGRLQVTFHGLPLYTYVNDRQAGQVTGQNVVDRGGTWVLSTMSGAPAGATTTAPSTPAPPAAAPTTTQAPASRPSSTTEPAVTTTAPRPPTTQPPPTTAPPTTTTTTGPPGLPSY